MYCIHHATNAGISSEGLVWQPGRNPEGLDGTARSPCGGCRLGEDRQKEHPDYPRRGESEEMTTIAHNWTFYINDKTVKSCEPSSLQAYETAMRRLSDFETGYVRIDGVYVSSLGETESDQSNSLM